MKSAQHIDLIWHDAMATLPLPHWQTLLESLHGTGLHEHHTAGLVLRSLRQRTPAPDSDH